MKYLKLILKKSLGAIGYFLAKVFPKNNRIIFFEDNQGNFNSNTKHLYLFFSKNKKFFKSYWLTSNKNVYNFLKNQKLGVIYTQSLKIFFLAPRAKYLFGIGVKPTNYLNLFSGPCIKVNLWHGFGPRTTNRPPKLNKKFINKIMSRKNIIDSINTWDYFFVPSDFAKIRIAKKEYKLPNYKIKVFGSPRCDLMFKSNKNFTKLDQIDFSKKIILYAPTWRTELKDNFKILELIKNFKDFSIFLKKNNYVFLFNLHPMYNDNVHFDLPDNIRFINPNPFFDINEILPKVSILISDYSSVVTDYLLIKKKVIFFLHDYNKYYKKIGLIDDFKKALPGREINNYIELKKAIKNKKFVNKKITKNIKLHLKKYYDVKYKNSSKKIFNFINNI